MKRKSLVIIFAIAILVIIGIFIFSKKDQEPTFTFDPADTSIYYETGAEIEEWGKYTFEIKKGGESTFNSYKDYKLNKTHTFQTSLAEFKKILDAIAKNNFLSLQEEYTDPSFVNGGYNIITIYYGDKSKTVRLNNYYLEPFDEIEFAINKIIYEKIEGDPYSFKD